MASATRDAPDEEGVEFIHGDTKAETLRMLAEAIELHEGGGEPVTDEDLEERDLEDTEPGDEEILEFMK